MTSTPTTDKSTPEEGLPLEARELAAYAIYKTLTQSLDSVEPRPAGELVALKDWPDLALKPPGVVWRDEKNTRFVFRNIQRMLFEELTQQGFTIKPPREKVLSGGFEDLRTIPAHPAYDPANDD